MSLPLPKPGEPVVVTGASAGIGAELARRLGDRGHPVVLVARRGERLEELAASIRSDSGVEVEVQERDLADLEQLRSFADALRERPLAALCNNAGVGSFGRFWELPYEDERRIVLLNVNALHELCGAVLPGMMSRGYGAVLNVGSIAGFQPQPANATYAATKAFVNSFSEALHAELSGTGVSCTVVCPGPVSTEFADRAGVGEFDSRGGSILWDSPEHVAETAVDGMAEGKRLVFPRIGNQVTATAGRLTPHAVVLPVVQRLMHRVGIADSGERSGPAEGHRL